MYWDDRKFSVEFIFFTFIYTLNRIVCGGSGRLGGGAHHGEAPGADLGKVRGCPGGGWGCETPLSKAMCAAVEGQ